MATQPNNKAVAAPPSYLHPAEVADLLHVSPKTVSRWAKEGRPPFLKTSVATAATPKPRSASWPTSFQVPTTTRAVDPALGSSSLHLGWQDDPGRLLKEPIPDQVSRAQRCADRRFPGRWRASGAKGCVVRDLVVPASGQGQAGAAWLVVRHAAGEELHQLGGGRRVEVAEADHHIAELGEDPQLPFMPGAPPPCP